MRYGKGREKQERAEREQVRAGREGVREKADRQRGGRAGKGGVDGMGGDREGRVVSSGTPPTPSLHLKVSDSVHGRAGCEAERGHSEPPPVSLKAPRRFTLPIWGAAGKEGKKNGKDITYSSWRLSYVRADRDRVLTQ